MSCAAYLACWFGRDAGAVHAICADLTAEHQSLDVLVARADLTVRTPAPSWTIADQLSHLAYFDEQALRALTDPDGFARSVDGLLEQLRAGVDPSIRRGRDLGSVELLDWWRRASAELRAAAVDVDPRSRVPWYGPTMGARSFVTARLMETWAHGQDVADALGVPGEATARLRHVAHIGVGARAFSYVAHGRELPSAPVRVELTAPAGELWTWGDEGAADVVRGPALDFCLLVTQRRHRDDVRLSVVGPAADEWLDIAQAFAGPPGPGRRPGQFAIG